MIDIDFRRNFTIYNIILLTVVLIVVRVHNIDQIIGIGSVVRCWSSINTHLSSQICSEVYGKDLVGCLSLNLCRCNSSHACKRWAQSSKGSEYHITHLAILNSKSIGYILSIVSKEFAQRILEWLAIYRRHALNNTCDVVLNLLIALTLEVERSLGVSLSNSRVDVTCQYFATRLGCHSGTCRCKVDIRHLDRYVCCAVDLSLWNQHLLSGHSVVTLSILAIYCNDI